MRHLRGFPPKIGAVNSKIGQIFGLLLKNIDFSYFISCFFLVILRFATVFLLFSGTEGEVEVVSDLSFGAH